jgi:hypothetical protein
MKLKGRCPKGRPSSKWEKTGYERGHTEGRNIMGRKCGGGAVGRQRQMERFGCQATHLKCKRLRKKIKYSVYICFNVE